MRRPKEEALHLINKMPDDSSFDDIIAELYFKQQVEQGLKDIESGRTYTHSQIKDMVSQWRKSSGRS